MEAAHRVADNRGRGPGEARRLATKRSKRASLTVICRCGAEAPVPHRHIENESTGCALPMSVPRHAAPRGAPEHALLGGRSERPAPLWRPSCPADARGAGRDARRRMRRCSSRAGAASTLVYRRKLRRRASPIPCLTVRVRAKHLVRVHAGFGALVAE